MSAAAPPDATASESFRVHCAELQSRLQTLPDKPEETVAATLRTLWQLAAGRPLSVEAAMHAALPPLDVAAEQRLQGLIEQRVSGVPLAHLSGRQCFMGLEMLAGKEALIPRRETELLGGAALDLLRAIAGSAAGATVIDVCTGSGNLALALAHHVPQARVFAADLSAEAVTLARRNAAHLGLEGRVEFRVGDLLGPFDEPAFHAQVQLLICNPPYISSKKIEVMAGEISGFEPRLAFDGGPLGIAILNRILREAPRFLAPGGWLAIEVGLGQAGATLKRLLGSGAYRSARALDNALGEPRAVIAQV
ncbi:MAG: peptide chain release factor N(5)-glutamine methyltransferase [Rhizobacter sp.]|nr:peptide chain release factor N(5)-glutamine methyltransferase [Rhizobacter sp.]